MKELLIGGIYNYGIDPEHTILITIIFKNDEKIIVAGLEEFTQQKINNNLEINKILNSLNKNDFSLFHFFRFDKNRTKYLIKGYLGNVSDEILTELQNKLKLEYPELLK